MPAGGPAGRAESARGPGHSSSGPSGQFGRLRLTWLLMRVCSPCRRGLATRERLDKTFAAEPFDVSDQELHRKTGSVGGRGRAASACLRRHACAAAAMPLPAPRQSSHSHLPSCRKLSLLHQAHPKARHARCLCRSSHPGRCRLTVAAPILRALQAAPWARHGDCPAAGASMLLKSASTPRP